MIKSQHNKEMLFEMLRKLQINALSLMLVFAGTCMAQPHHKSVPVLDNPQHTDAIKSFRAPLWQKDTTPEALLPGIDNLKVSASGQFSQSTLINTFKDLQDDLLILDLRLESHGFIDGTPISWYGKRNAINKGLPLDQITKTEAFLLSNLSNESPITVNDIIRKESGIIYEVEPHTINGSALMSEQTLVESLGYEYQRLPVLDRHPPSDQIIEQFVELVANLSPNHWLHLHCRGGKGRATTFMVLYDIIKNGHEIPLDVIFERQAFFGPKDLRKLPTKPEKLWKKPMAEARLNTLKDFYQYRTSEHFGNMAWTEYVQTQL